jgi:hypothetical protein
MVRLKTTRKRPRRPFNSVAQWGQVHRHDDVSKQQATLNAKLRGHYRYYGRPTNHHSLWQFYRGVRPVWKKWLNRRSRGKILHGEAYEQLLRRYPLLVLGSRDPGPARRVLPEEPTAVIL